MEYVGDTLKNMHTERGIRYDRNGNILSMTRTNGADPENLSFTYDGNRRSGEGFSYDANGNLTYDRISGVAASHDILNMPRSLYGDGDYQTWYTYLADGTKICSEVDETYSGYYYAAPFMYRQTNNHTLAGVSYGGDMIIRDADGRYSTVVYVRDHLGSTRARVKDGETVIGEYDYLPYGELTSYSDVEYANDFLYGGKEYEIIHDIKWYDSGARYQTTHGIFTSQDPLAEKYYSISPYAYCNNNPINSTDFLGLRPIYSTEGYLLGTDDTGIQGEQIIMDKKNFKQGMKTEEALKYDLGEDGLISEDAVNRFNDSYAHLKDRPDWDGYITLEEANEWYRSGSGDPLFADISKIDFSGYVSLGKKSVGKIYKVNLFLGSLQLDDALVYGTISVKRYPNHGIRAYSDHYDFDIKKPWILHLGRNVLTIVGAKVAGKGKPYDINIYGEKKIKPILPWVK